MKTSGMGKFVWLLWAILTLAIGVTIAFKENFASVFHYFIGICSESFLSLDNTVFIIMILAPFFPRKKELEKVLLVSMALAIFARFVLIKIGYLLIGTARDISLISGAVLIIVGLLCLFCDHGSSGNSLLSKISAKITIGTKMTNLSRYAYIFSLLLGIELVNVLLSIDSLSVAFTNSNRPVVVYGASFVGIILTRLFATHDGLCSKIIKYKKVIAISIMCIGLKTIIF